MAVRLRVFPEPVELFEEQPEPSVRVRLGDLLPLIALAKKHNYLWLQDFIDDEVTVTSDLYEVIRAFGYQRRPSA
jgi:hypothetical protein